MRNGASGNIAPDAIAPIIGQIEKIDPSSKEVDLLIESFCGDALTSWRIISILRARFNKIHVIVPSECFSAATILALGADSIVMGKYGCLGPIDPQITVANKMAP